MWCSCTVYVFHYVYAVCLRITIKRPEDEAKSNYYHQEPNFSVQVYKKVKGESARHILLIIHKPSYHT